MLKISVKWTNALIIILLFIPIPLGIRLDKISMLSIIGISLLFLWKKIKFQNLMVPGVLIVVSLFGTGVASVRGDEVNVFQALRGAVFPLILITLLSNPPNERFLADLDRFVPVIILGACSSVFAYYALQSDIYNSTLDIPFTEAAYKRIFVYPTYFFLVIFVESAWRGRKIQFVYGLLLAASGSKAIILSLVLVYFYVFLKRRNTRSIIVNGSALVLILIASIYLGMSDRVSDFVTQGDPWRVAEPKAALTRLFDPIRAVLGNGLGVKYWSGRFSLQDVEFVTRGMQNAYYDVHNGFLAIGLKFGLLGVILLSSQLWSSIKDLPFRWLVASVIFINVYLSHGPVQVVEAVGLGLGLILISYRNGKYLALQPPSVGMSRY